MASNLLDFLGALSPNSDGTPNAVQRFNTSTHPERQMEQIQMMGLMQELQQKQAVQTALQQWAEKGGGDPKSLYGALASTGNPDYLAKYTDMITPKPKFTQMGGNLVQVDENNPSVAPKVVYSQQTPDERKLTNEENKKTEAATSFSKKLERLNSLYDSLRSDQYDDGNSNKTNKSRGIRSTSDSNLDSFLHSMQSSEGVGYGGIGIPGGQSFGRTFSTKNQQIREEIQKEQAALLPLYMQAQGITPGMERAVTAQQLLNKALPDLDKSYEANKENIKSLKDLVPEASPAKNSPDSFKEGRTATLPSGVKVIFKGGRWQ